MVVTFEVNMGIRKGHVLGFAYALAFGLAVLGGKEARKAYDNYISNQRIEAPASKPIPATLPERRVEPYEEIPNITQNEERRIARGISQEGLRAIAGYEGLRLNVYNDVAGNPTIGYGHLIRPRENLRTVTQEQALELLRNDVASAEEAVNSNVNVDLTPNQYDALVSLVYNIGNGAFAGSTLLRELNSGDYEGAAQQFERWNRAGGRVVQGLANRRADERRRFEGN